MAAHIQQTLNIPTTCIEGERGEFSVRLNGRIVAEKTNTTFPSPEECLAAVHNSLKGSKNDRA